MYIRKLNFIISIFLLIVLEAQAAVIGDTLSLNGKRYKLLSSNLITNPGFEVGFFGWTDASTAPATLTSAKFSVITSGGVNNSKYLVGLANENSSATGSIGTGWPITSGKSYLFAYQVKYTDAAATSASETYLKISLTNDKASSAEPLVLINGSQVNGAGAWTQNHVFFSNTNPSYSYIQARFRWLNNRFGFDDFGLYEAVEVIGLTTALNNSISEAESLLLKTMQNQAKNDLNTALNNAKTVASTSSSTQTDLQTAKTNLDAAIVTAKASVEAYAKLQKAIQNAGQILGFLEKTDEITKLQNAINAANQSYANRDLTLAEVNTATTTLITITRSVGKQIYVPGWMMGDIYSSTNNWSIERSKQSKNWILFWEPGFGDNPGSTVDDCLALAEKSFKHYADSLKFILRGNSKTDTYKMIIRLRFTTEWEASGSGVDNTIGLLTLTPSALTSRGGQTIAHEVGHCFQYQTHCDNNDLNGWMYGYGDNASGGNGWWEQCAQWQAYKVFPSQQFSNEWFTTYLSNVHKHILHETPRYHNFFIQDFWCYKRGADAIGKLWNKSIKPEDPVEAYKRLFNLTQADFNDEMWECAARFATWDVPALKAAGANYINSRSQLKMLNSGNYVWRVDSTVCVENYGHNIIRLNAPTAAKTITVNFEGMAGSNGFSKINTTYAGWRFGFVALLKDGTRVYSNVQSAAMGISTGKSSLSFDCPANCDKLWLVVLGAPQMHWRHAWDDNDTNDEQWPYKIGFNNTNLFGFANVVSGIESGAEFSVNISTENNCISINRLNSGSIVQITDCLGHNISTEKAENEYHSINLIKGIYIVSVLSDSGHFVRKVIVH